jgi:hypothetical protein
MLSVSNDLFAPTEAAQTLRFNSGIRSAEGGANNMIYFTDLELFYVVC